MDKQEFEKLKLKFINGDIDTKIKIYTQTKGLTNTQYRELLRVYPYSQIDKLESALA